MVTVPSTLPRWGKVPRRSKLVAALIGRAIEDLIEAYALLGAGGKLTASRPSSDVDHKDFIFDERGGYWNLYAQVKGVTQVNILGEMALHVEFRPNEVLSDPRFVYIFVLLDLKTMNIKRIYLVPSPDFNRLAPRGKTKSGKTQLAFVAGKRSKWDRFQIEPAELGTRLLQILKATKPSRRVRKPPTHSLAFSLAQKIR